jgi:nucleoside-diphosphate-sugar epimerase
MKALVTGATGFVGSRLARHLADQGYAVSILARQTSNFDQLNDLRDRIDVHLVDNTGKSVRQAVAAARPDVVFHVATYYVFDHRPEDIDKLVEANITFPLHLVDAMAAEGIGLLVNTGSAWQHFNDAAYDPVCLHSATKQAFQALLAYFVSAGTIRCATLLLNDTYGPRDPRRKIFALVHDHAGKSTSLPMSGGQQLIELVHIDDIVRAFRMAGELLRDDDSLRNVEFNVATGHPLPLRSIVETFIRVAGLDVAIDWGARPYRGREVMVPWRTGRPVPGWSPQVPLEEGLAGLYGEDEVTKTGR